MQKKTGIVWGIVFIILVLLAYLIPYTFLTDVHAWYGGFLFWTVIAVVIIVFNFWVTRKWGK